MRHGTESMYTAGRCRCDECAAAKGRSHKLWALRTNNGERALRVPSRGVQRRIQALQAIGWTQDDIAHRLGYVRGRSITRLTDPSTENVHIDTHRKVDEVYQRLSGQPGPSSRVRAHAARKGWPAPLAWDDIDNDDAPNPGPKRSVGVDIDEWKFLVGGGVDPLRAAERLGVTISAIEMSARRHNRPDIYMPANRANRRLRSSKERSAA